MKPASPPLANGATVTGPPATHTTPSPLSYRQHAFLHVPVKHGVAVNLVQPIQTWIKKRCGAGVATACQATLETMESSRNKCLRVFDNYAYKQEDYDIVDFIAEQERIAAAGTLYSDLQKSGFHTHWLLYFDTMKSVLSKTFKGDQNDDPGVNACIPDLYFEYHNWLGSTHQHMTISCIRDELCCWVFNLAAMYSICGAVLPHEMAVLCTITQQDGVVFHTEPPAVLEHRIKNFRLAGIVFDHLAKLLDEYDLAFDELAPSTARLFSNLMLAQAQECMYMYVKESYRAVEMQPTICRHATTIQNYYRAVLSLFVAPNKQDLVPDAWYAHCNAALCTARVSTLMHHIWSIGDDKYSHRITFLNLCEEYLAEILSYFSSYDSDQTASEATHRFHSQLRLWIRTQTILTNRENSEVKRCYQKLRMEDARAFTVEPIDEVRVPARGQVQTQPVASLHRFHDALPQILSALSYRHWLLYREERAQFYLDHISLCLNEHDETLWRMFESKPELLLLYFLHQHLYARQNIMQTDLGNRFLMLRGLKTPPPSIQLADGVCSQSMPVTAVVFERFKTEEEAMDPKIVTLGIHKNAMAAEMNVCALLQEHLCKLGKVASVPIQQLASIRTDHDIHQFLFGLRYSELFQSKAANLATLPSLPSASTLATPPATGDSDAATSSPQLTAATVKQIVTLVSLITKRDQLENDLVDHIISNIDEAYRELTEAQLSDSGAWIRTELKWLINDLEVIGKVIETEKRLVEQIQKLPTISADILYQWFAAASTETKSAATPSVPLTTSVLVQPSVYAGGTLHGGRLDLLADELANLYNLSYTALFYTQCTREARLASILLGRIKEDSQRVLSQLNPQ